MAGRLWLPLRVAHARPRLAASALAGLILAVALPGPVGLAARILVGWDAGVVLYLLLIVRLFAAGSADDIREHARREDEGRAAILVLTAAAALASIGAIVVVLAAPAAAAGAGVPALVLAAATIVLSWAFTHVTFALHYAFEFYDEEDGGGLAFPEGTGDPDYLDFLYFSLVIGMTSQVSDVAVRARPIRRTVTAHGVLAFFLNVAVVALLVNVAGSFMAGSGG